jgi:hypothetical protein
VNLKKLPVKNETISEQTNEIASLQIQIKAQDMKHTEIMENATKMLNDRISFYEVLTQVVIVGSTRDEMIYECQIAREKCVLTFTIGPALDDEENKIEYSPGTFQVINKKGELVNAFESLPGFLKHKIKFEERLTHEFLIRLHKNLDMQKK